MSLSERIAALNKRAQPPLAQHSAPQTGAIPSSSNGSKSVKDKAARFDHLGAAPAPRGSFGLGAPVAASQKSNRELYGNRIPSASVGKDGKLAHSGSATSLRAGSPGPTHSLRAAQSNPSSPSPSHSRTSSFDSNAGSLIGGRAQAATPAEPLTEAAVESLGAAVRRTPSGGAQAFQSVPPSVFAGEKDASSSIAVEADEASVATQSVDVNISGKASPSLTSSTVSESVLKEPPPVITSPELSDGSEVARASLDTESSFATARSASSVIPPDSSQTPGIPTITSSEHLAMHPVVEPSVAPLPLSSHLLETLQVNASGEASPSRSVVVEIGSGGGSQSDDIAEALEGVDLSEKALDATVAAGGAGTGVDADVDLDVRPNLRLQAPVLPLSSAHLKSLNIQSSLVPSSGYDTPRSMAVEVGDGSVDGRSVREIFSDENPIDEEYITSEGLSDMHTPPGLQIDLPGDGPRPGTASPRLSSPVKTSGRSKGSPVTPTKRLGTPDGAARKSSLSTLSIPGTPSDVVDMTTPIANPSELPDEHLTPPAVERSREEVELNVQPFPAPSFNDEKSKMFALSPGGGGRSPTTTRERLSPSLISRKTLPTVVFPPSSAKGYANKPLPPPPPPTPPMQPDTPMIIQAFPTIPGRPAVPSPERPSLMFPTPTRQRARSSFGSAPSSPLLTPTGVSRHDRSPSPSPTIAVDGSLAPPSPRYAGQSQLPYLKPRPQTTYDGESPTIAAPTHQGRSVSVSSLQEPVVKRRPKKPKLVPGVWIGDDDVRDEDDEETGWANIVVTKHVLG